MIPHLRHLSGSVLIVAALIVSGCGGGSNVTPNPRTPPKVSIVVSPITATVEANGGTQQFAAAVMNTTNTAVTWQVNQITGGTTSTGSISTTGLYTAPAVLPSPSVVSVTATSQADTTASSTATVTIAAPPAALVVSVSPLDVNVAAASQAQFTATVINSDNTAVSWQVDGIEGGNSVLGTISASGLYNAPLSAVDVTITAVAKADATKSANAALTVLAPHALATRPTASGIAEFYNTVDGNVFLPRGNNLIRLATQTSFFGYSINYHSTFNVDLYDSVRAETALAAMQTSGYNTVRVWINGCCQGSVGDSTGGLNSSYVANVVDFLQRAHQRGIYVIFTLDWVPDTSDYVGRYSSCDSRLDGYNRVALCAAGVDSNVAFFKDFVRAMVAQGAPLDAIFAYELRNEYFYDSDQFPLNTWSGSLTAADGVTYDLSNADGHQQMMNNALVYFTDKVAAGIKTVDPSALVTVGFFWPQTPNFSRPGDQRVISVYPAMAASTADFIDIHGYSIPGDLTVTQLIQNYAITGQDKKPVMMGEFGAFKSSYPEITSAAQILKDWQISTCPYNVKGWLLWTWDTEEPEQVPALWPALSGDGSINQALSPVTRPDPCQ